MNWVQCDRCELWFHLLCVGIKAEDIRDDEDYVCFSCREGGTGNTVGGSPARPGTKEGGEGKIMLDEADIKKEVVDDVGSVVTKGSSPPCSPSAKAAADKAILEVVEAVAASSKERRIEAEKREEAVESMIQLERGVPSSEAAQDVEIMQTEGPDGALTGSRAENEGQHSSDGGATNTATSSDEVVIVEPDNKDEEDVMQIDDDEEEEIEGEDTASNVEAGDEASAGVEEEDIDEDVGGEDEELGIDKTTNAEEKAPQTNVSNIVKVAEQNSAPEDS